MSSHLLLRKFFAYDDWANRDVLENLKKHGTARSQKLLAHIVAAEVLWMDRIHGEKQRMAVWPELSLEQIAQELKTLPAGWNKVLENSGPKTVRYRNSKGEEWSSSVEDILTHVVMHSAYHRGQIAADVRAGGGEPAYTDYIHAARQGFVK